MHPPLRPLLAAAVLAATAAAAAPESAPAASPASAPASQARSALDGYLRFDDVKPVPWQQANETVRANGGWRAYAKEAQEQTAPAAPTAAPPAAHHSHGGEAR